MQTAQAGVIRQRMDPSRITDPKFTFRSRVENAPTDLVVSFVVLTGSESQRWCMEGGRRRGGCGRVGVVGGGGVWLGFYFLMAATAFTAASSRSSAAMMGRPLSVRIRLASCTLVPETRRKTVTAAPGGGVKPHREWVEPSGRGHGCTCNQPQHWSGAGSPTPVLVSVLVS